MAIILGINASFTSNHHDPSAVLIVDGEIVSACEEERFNRTKSSIGWFPYRSIDSCLNLSGTKPSEIDWIASPGITAGDELIKRIQKEFRHYFGVHCEVRLYSHALCHVAGAFYPSGFTRALGLSIDGSGDGKSMLVADCSLRHGIREIDSFDSTNSIGNLFSAITERLGFHRTEGEFKVMGMAANGDPNSYDLSSLAESSTSLFEINQEIYSNLRARSCYESFYDQQFFDLLGLPSRRFNEEIHQEHFDLASSLQKTFESLLLKILKQYRFDYEYLVYSGGCALNCLANRHLPHYFSDFYVMPAASDRGLSLGAACLCAFEEGIRIRPLQTMLLGPGYSNDSIKSTLDLLGVSYMEGDKYHAASQMLADGKVIGWFQGRSEFGPRALGARSVLANAKSQGIKDQINAKIKYRESYRPFAPAVLKSLLPPQFDNQAYNYMAVAADLTAQPDLNSLCGEAVHTDGSARIQRVCEESSYDLYHLLHSSRSSGIQAVINTSFNLNGEPIVESPRDAIRTFFASAIDALVIGNYIIEK